MFGAAPWCWDQEEPPPGGWGLSCLSWQGLSLTGRRAPWELALALPLSGVPTAASPRERVELLWLLPASAREGWVQLLSRPGQTQFPHPENVDAAPERAGSRALSPRPPSASHVSALPGVGHTRTRVHVCSHAQMLTPSGVFRLVSRQSRVRVSK